MASFQRKLAAGLERRGYGVAYSLDERPYDAVLVVGGTRQLFSLRRARMEGIPIVQRLDGLNWIHRVRKTGARHYLRAEYGNLILQYIRTRLAGGIVYQSEFSREWWELKRGKTPVRSVVIHNGIDLNVFTPDGPNDRPGDRCRILMVEGALAGGYEVGLSTGVQLVQKISQIFRERPVELAVAGRVAEPLKEKWVSESPVHLTFIGVLPNEQVPGLDRSAHMLYEGDINAACPNAVVEALACGLPVVAFASGAMAELVPPTAGRIVPYGGDPWKLDPPDVPALAQAAAEVLSANETFRQGARQHAEQSLGLDQMVDRYLEFFLNA